MLLSCQTTVCKQIRQYDTVMLFRCGLASKTCSHTCCTTDTGSQTRSHCTEHRLIRIVMTVVDAHVAKGAAVVVKGIAELIYSSKPLKHK